MRRARTFALGAAAAAALGLGLAGGASGQVITLPPLTTTTTLAPLTDPIVDVVGSLVTTTTVAVSDVTVPVPVVDTTTVSTTVPVVTVPAVDGVVTTLTDCTSYATQTLAQAALLADPTLAATLDPDHDGIACEILPAAPGLPVPTTAPAPVGSSGGVTTAGSPTGSTTESTSSTWTGPTAAPYGSSGAAAGSDGTGRAFPASSGSRLRGAAGAGTVELDRPAQSAIEAAASSPLPDRDGGADGPAHVLLKVVAFVMLLGVTAAAAAQRDQLLTALAPVRT